MDQAEVVRTLKKIGLRPQQAAGQNFLLSRNIVTRMVHAATITPSDVVLEIGSGLGVLTDALLAAGATVIAVELDKRLFGYLQQRYAQQKNLKLVQADIFRLDLSEFVTDGQYKVVANLPYSGTSLFFRNFLSVSPRPISMTVMIQREVARRLTASPGEMSVLSVMAQYYSRVAYLFDVPRTEFYPPPNVDSAAVMCRLKSLPDPVLTKKFFQVVRAGFSSRRKQLHNALAAGLHLSTSPAGELLRRSGVPGDVRAQDLTLEEWLNLAKNYN